MPSKPITNTLFAKQRYDIIYVYSDEYPDTWIAPRLGNGYVTNSLQEAKEKIKKGGNIYVGQGTFKPTKVCEELAAESGAVRDRCRTFDLSNLVGVSIYGGFFGNETTTDIGVPGGRKASYDWFTRYTFDYPTVLSGDHTGVDGDKSYHVVYTSCDISEARNILSSITITGGNADGGGLNRYGGGVYLNHTATRTLVLRGCNIIYNKAIYGGGMYDKLYNSQIFMPEDCLIAWNSAVKYGGAYVRYPNLLRFSFIDNVVSNDVSEFGYDKMYGSINSYAIISCYFHSLENTDFRSINGVGGHFHIVNSLCVNAYISHPAGGIIVINTTIIGKHTMWINTAFDGVNRPSLYNSLWFGELEIVDYSTVVPNVELLNCHVKTLIDSTATGIVVLPQLSITQADFKDPSNNDYSLKPWSAGINAGDNALAYGTVDLAGKPRIKETVDLGCFELQETRYSLEIQVGDVNATALNGATVVVDGKTMTTVDGLAFILLLEDHTYDVQVSLDGYNSQSNEVTMDVDNKVIAFALVDTSCDATIQVQDEDGNPLSGVELTYDNASEVIGTSIADGVIKDLLSQTLVISNIVDPVKLSLYHPNHVYKAQALTLNSKTTDYNEVVTMAKKLNKVDIVVKENVYNDYMSGELIIDGESYYECIFQLFLPTGNYPFSLYEAGYNTIEDTLVITEDTQVELVLESLSYQIKFIVKNSAGAAMQGAEIAIADQTRIVGEMEGFSVNEAAIILVGNQGYNYTISRYGYEDYSGNAYIGDCNEIVNVILQAIYNTMTFYVMLDGLPIAGAVVMVDNVIHYTDVNGEFSGQYPFGTHEWSVSYDGYITKSGSEVIRGLDVSYIKDLTKASRMVTFNVKDGDDVASVGTPIVVAGQTLTTDADGKASIELPIGTHAYSIAKYGYNTHSSSVVVAYADIQEDVTFELNDAFVNYSFRTLDTWQAPLSGVVIQIKEAQTGEIKEYVSDGSDYITVTVRKAYNSNYYTTVTYLYNDYESGIANLQIYQPGLHTQTIRYYGGRGIESNPWRISRTCDISELYQRHSSNRYYQQVNDISLSGISHNPIGSKASPFKGQYDGGNYNLTDMRVVKSDEAAYLGLFGYTSRDDIASHQGIINVNLKDCYVQGGSDIQASEDFGTIGSLVGYNDAEILNCSATGDIVSRSCGGLVGITGNLSKIKYTRTDVNIISYDRGYIGGFVARNYGSIFSCEANGSITATSPYCVGGFVGAHRYTDSIYGIDSCRCTGSINVNGNVNSVSWASDKAVGSFCGYAHDGIIIGCYTISPITCEDSDYKLGGFLAEGRVTDGGWFHSDTYEFTVDYSYYNETDSQVTREKSHGGTESTQAKMMCTPDISLYDNDHWGAWDLQVGAYPTLKFLNRD